MPLTSQHPFRPLRAAILAVVVMLPPGNAVAQELAGPYLAARFADSSGDFRHVVEYGTRVLAQDPQNRDLMEGLLVAQMGLGDFDQAVPVARRLMQLEPGNQIGSLVMLADAMAREDWDQVLDLIESGASVGEVLDDVVTAWAHLGQGRMSQSLEIFDKLSQEETSGSFVAYQRALALALAGDHERAADLFAGAEGTLNLDRAGVIAYAQILSQLERNPDALDLVNKAYPDKADTEIETLRAELAAGKPVPFTAVRSARDGLAELFFSVAQSLAREREPNVVLLYSRTAEHLRPDNYEATYLSASLLEMMDRFDLAVETYGSVPADNRLYLPAALSRAEALRRWDHQDEAIAALEVLAAEFPGEPDVHITLGDTLRFREHYDAASRAYDRAIDLIEDENPVQWSIYFARGICHERENRWPQAEADFRKALELDPDQPRVLNYLGYSLVEQGTNLDEALDMIERAVAARPDDGYIVDSLGWVYYRLGRYPEAVEQMERAVEFLPVDPVVNDHLGDTYWAVGRHREAEFQWSRALSFIDDDTDLEEVRPDRIRRKLEVGLDAVLSEEGASPLSDPNEDG